MKRIDLNGLWKIEGISPQGEKVELMGNMPGSALNAVLNSDIEKNLDVFYRDNAEKVQKYENYNWVFSKTFEIDSLNKKMLLVFEKIDTYCDVYMNDKHIAYCDNGYISHSFEVGKNLVVGENRLTLYFHSPVLHDAGRKKFTGAFTTERMYTRRPQCTYGWDWTMRFATCGIGDAYIEEVSDGMKVETAYIYTKSIDEDSAEIVVDVDFADFECGGIVDVKIIAPDGEVAAKYKRYNEEPFMRINLDVVNPKLWYPNGYGEQHLYTLEISCEGEELYTTPFGIRTIKIMELPDKEGSENYKKCIELKKTNFSKFYDKNEEFSGFILKINGTKIMCKGANWVPCEPFAKGNTDKKVTQLLELAKEAGVNMLRVWGGGDFETEHFYDECSRLGIMVTQDFLMACGRYPEDDKWFLEQLRKEADYISDLIRNKACLVWWSGDNENAIEGCDTDMDYQGRASAYKAIFPVLSKRDYNRRFLASSPYGGTFYASNTKGTTHNSQFLGLGLFPYMLKEDVNDYKDYLKLYNARFIAEEPTLGAVSEQTLKKFMADEDIYGNDMKMWDYHSKSNPALDTSTIEYACSFAEGILGKFKDGEDRLFKLKYLQYEWIRVTLERARREKWFCSGIVYWMFNDCWPAAAGWALVDYYGLPKASYYSFKRGAKQIVMSIDLKDAMYKFHICNDGKAEKLDLKWYAVAKDGSIVYTSEEKAIYAETNTSLIVYEMNESELPDDCFIVADVCGENGVFDRAFYRKGNLEIIPCDDKIELIAVRDGSVTVKAKAYVHAVELCGDAVFEDNYFSMLPGEERIVSFKVTGEEQISVKAYTII